MTLSLPSHHVLGYHYLYWRLVVCSQCQKLAIPESLEASAGSWQQLGGTLDVDISQSVEEPTLVVDATDRAVVAWRECTSGYPFQCNTYRLVVKRWNGTQWVKLGNLTSSHSAGWPSMILDSASNPVVAWTGYYTDSSLVTIQRTTIKRWDGSGWVRMGAVLDNTSSPKLARDSSGNIFAAWANSSGFVVKRWNGSQWVQVTTPTIYQNPALSLTKLAIDNLGRPVAIWEVSDSSSHNIYVKYWNGTNWIQLGNFINIDSSKYAEYPTLVGSGSNETAKLRDGPSNH